jgi:hypothetical protein
VSVVLASPPAILRAAPSTAHRGTVVTFTGSGCLQGDTVFLISRLFLSSTLKTRSLQEN